MDAFARSSLEHSQPARNGGRHRGGARNGRAFCRRRFLAVLWRREFGATGKAGGFAAERERLARRRDGGGRAKGLRWACGIAGFAVRDGDSLRDGGSGRISAGIGETDSERAVPQRHGGSLPHARGAGFCALQNRAGILLIAGNRQMEHRKWERTVLARAKCPAQTRFLSHGDREMARKKK